MRFRHAIETMRIPATVSLLAVLALFILAVLPLALLKRRIEFD